MSWLLDDDWNGKWRDRDFTFCNFLPSSESQTETVSPATLSSYLKFTQVELKWTPVTVTDGFLSENCHRVSRGVWLWGNYPQKIFIFMQTGKLKVADATVDFDMENIGFKVNVVCTNQGLRSLPKSLPPDTIFLYLDNNKVNMTKTCSEKIFSTFTH